MRMKKYRNEEHAKKWQTLCTLWKWRDEEMLGSEETDTNAEHDEHDENDKQ